MTDTRLSPEGLAEVLGKHATWVRGDRGGARADLSDANLQGADLSGANLQGANLQRASLRGAYLSDASLRGAYLSDAYLSDASLRGAYLSDANLRGANLSGANLQGAYLQGAYLSDANLQGADLSGANLSGANLSGANLSGANLRGANLSGVNLSGANLSEARGITWAAVSWPGHGECGRQLLAVRIAGEVQAFCGCFRGTLTDLREYIERGDPQHRESRTQARVIVEALIAGVPLAPVWGAS